MRTIDELGISRPPWSVRDEVPLEGGDDPCGKWLVDGDGNDLITALDGDGIDGITANARLIAAAPELYEALRTAVEVIEKVIGAEDLQANCHNGTVFKLPVCKQKMIEAIAKASGEEAR